MKLLFYPTVWLLCFFTLPLVSQDIVKVKGENRLKQEDNMTRLQALEQVEMNARINAIENEFGRLVEQESDIRLKDSKVTYNIIGSTRVKGDWISTDKKTFEILCNPVTVDGNDNVEIWIKCRVEGEARKAMPRPEIEVQTRNCPQPVCKTSVFQNGDSLYVSLKSPVNGYLSIFLEAGDLTFRLFPYSCMENRSYFKINGDKEYILFSTEKEYDAFPGYPADPLILQTDMELENNILYIVFAENEYFKPSLSDVKENSDGSRQPKSMKTKDFNDWIVENSKSMMDFHKMRIQISIEKN